MEIRYYKNEDGNIPFEEWFDSLTPDQQIKVDARLDRVELGNLGDTNNEGEGVFALRGKGEFTYRIYCMKDGLELVILLCGGIKSKQQQRDISLARSLKKEYKERKDNDDVTVNRQQD